MIGDDVSDETALTAAQALGGFGLQVAGGRFTRDSARFSGPADVLAWLKGLAATVPA
jgi:trehalose 6-phosphate phosphatase